MCNYPCMHWTLTMCLNTSNYRIISNINTRAENPGSRAVNAYGTSARAENPCSRAANAYGTRRSRCDRHTRNQAMHIHIETLIIWGKTQKMRTITLHTYEDQPHTDRDPSRTKETKKNQRTRLAPSAMKTSTDGLQPGEQQLKEQTKKDRQQSIVLGKSPNPFTQINSYKHNIGPTIASDMADLSRMKANRANRKENKITLNGTTGQRLVTTATPKNSPKELGAMRCMRNRAESAYHADEKRYTTQTL